LDGLEAKSSNDWRCFIQKLAISIQKFWMMPCHCCPMGFSAIQVVSLKCLVRVFFVRNFAMSKDKSLSEAAPRKAASPQQSLKASFRFVFGLRAL
jgi:hypothetical protein